jgi:hypothetical protein
MAGNDTQGILKQIDELWRPFMAEVERLGESGIEQPTTAGWSAKEMLAHIAFWDEAVEGAVTMLFRQASLPEGWRFGSGYMSEDGDWPQDFVHNAREAEWARRQPAEAVLSRLESAHQRMLTFMETVTDEEVAAHPEYFPELAKHYQEHLPELQGLKRV